MSKRNRKSSNSVPSSSRLQPAPDVFNEEHVSIAPRLLPEDKIDDDIPCDMAGYRLVTFKKRIRLPGKNQLYDFYVNHSDKVVYAVIDTANESFILESAFLAGVRAGRMIEEDNEGEEWKGGTER